MSGEGTPYPKKKELLSDTCLILEKYKAAGDPVMEPLAFLGEADHQETDEDDEGRDELGKVPECDAGEGWFVAGHVGDYNVRQ